MAPPQKTVLRPLTDTEQARLEQVRRASSERMDRVRRATAILLVAQGHSFAQAAQRAGFRSSSSVANLVDRFNQAGLAALTIARGRGRAATYDRVARAQIVATAQRPPDRTRDGTATWSLKLLERRLRRAAFPRLGATTIRRVLQDAGSSYQRTRSWCPTGTARRVRKSGSVTVVDPQTEQKKG